MLKFYNNNIICIKLAGIRRDGDTLLVPRALRPRGTFPITLLTKVGCPRIIPVEGKRYCGLFWGEGVTSFTGYILQCVT